MEKTVAVAVANLEAFQGIDFLELSVPRGDDPKKFP
jgi:hypothetical protein